jgi:hypothetical protein
METTGTMEATGTCPRGHAVEPGAVLCTVCWVRLDGEDPQSKRNRILSLVSRPVAVAVVGGVVLAAGVGGALLLANPSAPPAVVAGASSVVVSSPSPSDSTGDATSEAPGDSPTPSPSESAADQPLVTSVPLAATVANPVVTGPDGTCVLDVLDQQATCRTEGDLVRFEVCVPAQTAAVELRTRSTKKDPWTDVSSDIVLIPGSGCAADGQRADVALAAAVFDVTESKWRLVGRGTGGDKLWKSKLRPAG